MAGDAICESVLLALDVASAPWTLTLFGASVSFAVSGFCSEVSAEAAGLLGISNAAFGEGCETLSVPIEPRRGNTIAASATAPRVTAATLGKFECFSLLPSRVR